ncbi:MAG: zinc transporter ZupT [Candidatus Abyssobacteria bacterium SURF_5]|uniref:Zinc transporter ZupT n=1 Tax=Abyssobacteria bacterium (strain SURF_5) TaxID=2093360 RepID=A0A3A4NFA4_ABYX5|nr:MAG: zinc transporter ZupT [Candidatus Abyssubacteria bacterium SURF_5]
MAGNIGQALLLTTVAGLATGVGSIIAFFIKKPKTSYLSFSLGFSAGVMIFISFAELLSEAVAGAGKIWGFGGFFIGIVFIGIIDRLVPEVVNPHHVDVASYVSEAGTDEAIMKTGIPTALAIAIHNFPEGLVTFGTALTDVKLGAITAFAIAIHNIPEGVSVSVPIFYATGNRKKAFLWSFLSGATEPVGALVGFLLLMPFLTEKLLAPLLAVIAGIMVYISLDELIPMAHRYGHGHIAMFGVVLGMFIMALGLLMF